MAKEKFFQGWMYGVAAATALVITPLVATAYIDPNPHRIEPREQGRWVPNWLLGSQPEMPQRFVRHQNAIQRAAIIRTVHEVAREENVPVQVALAVGIQESGLRPAHLVTGPRTGAVGGHQRAVGTYQILPSTGRLHGCGNLRDTRENIRCGMRILGRAIRSNNGDIGLAVREYHGGPNRRYWGRNNAAYYRNVMARAGLRYGLSAAGSSYGAHATTYRTRPIPVDQYPHTW